MSRYALLSALQAAMLGTAGGIQGSLQAKERERREAQEAQDRQTRELINLITFGREAVEPGPLATRVPAGTPAPAAPKSPPPSSVIPLPAGPVDMAGATRQLEAEEATPSGTIPLTFAGKTIYVPIGQRYRDIQEAARTSEEERAFNKQIRLAQALQPLEVERATASARISAGAQAAERATAKQQREDEAEAWWNSNVRGQAGDVATRAAQTFDRLRAAKENKNRPARELIAAVYDAEVASAKRTRTAGGAEAPPAPFTAPGVGKPVISKAEHDKLVQLGYSSADIRKTYEVTP